MHRHQQRLQKLTFAIPLVCCSLLGSLFVLHYCERVRGSGRLLQLLLTITYRLTYLLTYLLTAHLPVWVRGK